MDKLIEAPRALRAPPAEERSAEQYLIFMLGGETFALGIACIKEIVEYGGLTSVPAMPAFVRGIVDRCGAAVPVVDLSTRFGRDASAIGRRSCIVILESGEERENREFGIVVDGVNEVRAIAEQDVEPAPAFGARLDARFVRGLGKVDGRFVVILAADRVLWEDDATIHGEH